MDDIYFDDAIGTRYYLSDFIERAKERTLEQQMEAITPITFFEVGGQALINATIQGMIEFDQAREIADDMRNTLPSDMVGDWLDNLGLEKGVPRKRAVNSTGTLLFTIDSPAEEDIIITEDTEVSTKDSILFIVDEEAVLLKDTSSVIVAATCDIPGTVGNVGAGTITELLTDYNYDISVTNPNSFIGGEDEEDDDSYRYRVMSSENNYPPLSKSWYEALTNSISNVNDSYAYNIETGDRLLPVEIIFNCKDKTLIDETLIEILQLFEKDEYKAPLNLTITPAVERPVFNDRQIKVLIDNNYQWDSVLNDIVNTLKTEYWDKRTIGADYDTRCVLFFVETVPGVLKASLVGDHEKLECSVYEVFTTDYSSLAERFVEVDLNGL